MDGPPARVRPNPAGPLLRSPPTSSQPPKSRRGPAGFFIFFRNRKDAREPVVKEVAVPVPRAVAAGQRHTVGCLPDGTVVATGSNSHGQLEVDSWCLG
ncbi:MAG: hypothetical protein HG423_014480 [Propionibacterium sp.]|nr:hypothetical protein [Propionibacterium sp.]